MTDNQERRKRRKWADQIDRVRGGEGRGPRGEATAAALFIWMTAPVAESFCKWRFVHDKELFEFWADSPSISLCVMWWKNNRNQWHGRCMYYFKFSINLEGTQIESHAQNVSEVYLNHTWLRKLSLWPAHCTIAAKKKAWCGVIGSRNSKQTRSRETSEGWRLTGVRRFL